jgi:hypothetical protein
MSYWVYENWVAESKPSFTRAIAASATMVLAQELAHAENETGDGTDRLHRWPQLNQRPSPQGARCGRVAASRRRCLRAALLE